MGKEVKYSMESKDERLAGLKEQLGSRGLEHSVVHQVEPSLRSVSQVAFNPSLVDDIVNHQKDDTPQA